MVLWYVVDGGCTGTYHVVMNLGIEISRHFTYFNLLGADPHRRCLMFVYESGRMRRVRRFEFDQRKANRYPTLDPLKEQETAKG
jgi:hypothetical protein